MANPYPHPDSTVARSGIDALAQESRGGIERLSSEAHGAVDYAANVAASASDRVVSKTKELLAARNEWMDATRGYVREHPLTVLGAVLAAGYLLNRIIRR
ncbi:MAG TPA: hypothetical protein VLC73_01745 [Burkholderiales bacterium]|nr:hypothetical protein [Burkholderiales bacterium]